MSEVYTRKKLCDLEKLCDLLELKRCASNALTVAKGKFESGLQISL